MQDTWQIGQSTKRRAIVVFVFDFYYNIKLKRLAKKRKGVICRCCLPATIKLNIDFNS